MKKWLLCAASMVACLAFAVLIPVGAANASTSCYNHDDSDVSGTWKWRECHMWPAVVPGASFYGDAIWQYKGNSATHNPETGEIDGGVTLDASGHCAYVRIAWAPDSGAFTWSRWLGHSCTVGDKQPANYYTLNTEIGHSYTYGVWRLQLCWGQSTCTTIWHQHVAATPFND